MSNEFEDVKICVQSLLTSSQNELNIEQLLIIYRELEGQDLPYQSLGFNSVIELLQNMNDILTLPQNPNHSSMISLIVGEKSSHLRSLIIKQKPNTTKKKQNTTKNIRNNKYKNISQNTGRNYYRSYAHFISNSSHSSNFSSINKSPSEVQNRGFVTDELRLHLEKYISENQMLITKDKLKELVKNHPDFLSMKTKCMQDVINHVKSFLNITEKGVSLKVIDNHDLDIPNTSLKPFDVVHNSLPSTSNINNSYIKNKNSTMNYSKQFSSYDELTDKNISDLQNLKFNHQQDDPNHLEYVDICKKQCMIGKLQDLNSSYDLNKDLDIPKDILNENIEYVKRQSEIKMKQDIKKEFSKEKKSNYFSGIPNGTSSLNKLNTFFHSTSKMNKHDIHSSIENSKILNKNQCVPKDVLYNISKIFMVYRDGMNIENYTFIYYILYHYIFDPTVYGFSSVLQLFKSLYEMVEIRNNVLYTKNEFMYSDWNENINYELDNILAIQKNIIQHIHSNKKLEISLNIEQPLLPLVNYDSKLIMVLVEAYNPSLFYLQLADNVVELNHLMNLMQNFYAEENTSYFVQPEQMLRGSIYATSYTTFSIQKQWYRVRILREINLKTVEVIHVDYGTVDRIPKIELRFLKQDFCHLPCQAIQCCLTGYNQLETIPPEVSEVFVQIIGNKTVIVQIDRRFILSKDCSILHVTLFHSNSHNSEKLKSINDELTIQSILLK